MKKVISLLLVLVMCFSLCACNGVGSKDILGEWIPASREGKLVFNSNKTGELILSGESESFTWKYDRELDVYVVATSYFNFNATIKTQENISYVSLNGTNFYRAENYDVGLGISLNNYQAKVEEFVAGKAKLQLNTEYILENGTVKYTGVSLGGDGNAIVLSVTVTNTGSAGISFSGILPTGYSKQIYYYGGGVSGGGGIAWEYNDGDWLEAGETKTTSCKFHTFKDDDAANTLNAWGKILGAVYIEMDGTEYYIDLSEHIVK